MAWFKVDDRLHLHRKTRQVRRSHPDKSRDSAPFGLWVLAGSWCGQSGTNGFVPMEILLDFDDDAEALSKRLVEAGLFTPDTVKGDDGFWFHEYEEHNPVEEVDAGKWGAHLRWHVQRQIIKDDCPHCVPSIGVDGGHMGGDMDPQCSPVPSRPDPDPSKDTRARETPEPFNEFCEVYPGNVQTKRAFQVWPTAVRAARGHKPILDGARAYADYVRRAGIEPRYIRSAINWLRDEGWRDELKSPTRASPPSNIESHVALVNQLAAREASPQQRQIGAGT